MNLNFNNGNFAQLEVIPIHLIHSTKIIETNIIYINIQMKCTRLKYFFDNNRTICAPVRKPN